jgi:acetoin utilization deacetylase AcuC-like enzyme
VRVVYSARYQIDIGLHVFPTAKYRLVRDRLVETGLVDSADIIEPEPASWDELALVHTPDYLSKLRTGAMSPGDVAQLELPWSAEMVEGFRLMVGGTIRAGLIATGAEVRSEKLEVRSRVGR